MGRLNVSLNLRAGGFFGFEDGVCTAQHFMNTPIIITNVTPINIQAHQFS